MVVVEVVLALFAEVKSIGKADAVAVIVDVQVLVLWVIFQDVAMVVSAIVPNVLVALWPDETAHPPERVIVALRVALPPSIIDAWASNSLADAALEGAVAESEFMDSTFMAVSDTLAAFEGAPFIVMSVNLFDALGLVGTMFWNATVLVPPRVTEFPEKVPA